jgi:DNA replication and repair protein RecF
VVWVKHLAVSDLRNIREVSVDLHPGLNVFCGRNAQGKTSLLEAVGLLARGRSFRTEDSPSLIRRGAPGLRAGAEIGEEQSLTRLEVQLEPGRRQFRVDGREVMPREYRGRLEVVVYSTDRLRVIRGPMRERRLFLDRSASALWPGYRADARAFERVLTQRNAALQDQSRDLPVWTQQLVEAGARLRSRRATYAARLSKALGHGYRPEGEEYEVVLRPEVPGEECDAQAALAEEIDLLASRERHAGRTLAGPHRDTVQMLLNGRDAAQEASSGQARSLLLALALASLEVYREETGRTAVALLDDLDSELDPDRTGALCRDVAAQAQALVTSAHPGWTKTLGTDGRVFQVSEGEVRAA